MAITLSGKVYDSTGAPIAGATVYAYYVTAATHAVSGTSSGSAASDSTGYWEIAGLADGLYECAVTYLGQTRKLNGDSLQGFDGLYVLGDIKAGGLITVTGAATFSGGVSVTGNIAVTGTVDGVDVSTLKSDFDAHLASPPATTALKSADGTKQVTVSNAGYFKAPLTGGIRALKWLTGLSGTGAHAHGMGVTPNVVLVITRGPTAYASVGYNWADGTNIYINSSQSGNEFSALCMLVD